MLKTVHIALLVILTSIVANINAGSAINQPFDFYGHTVTTESDQFLFNFKLQTLSQKEITQKLNLLRSGGISSTAKSLQRSAAFYNLDAVGLSLLIDKYASRIAGEKRKNEKTFIKYVLLKELGYDVVLTRTEGLLNCLGNTSFKPGRYIYINYANKVYKDLDFSNRTNYPKHLVFMDSKKTFKVISRNSLIKPKINAKKSTKAIEVKYGFETHSYRAWSNASLTEYLGDLPLFDVGYAFTRTSLSKELNISLINKLEQTVDTLPLIDAVKYLLAFTQQVTPYGSDYDKYGEETYYYPEQTIMAKTADCEDKAMLLSYLAKRLLNVNSVALYFENDEHLSLALELPDYRAPNTFVYKNKTYVCCEPTAQYPKLGQSQFSLQRVTDVIPL
jgi:hypothetical protein